MGNANYIFVDSACGNIHDLAVTLQITQDLVAQGTFSIQLNTYAPPGLAVGSMQYTMNFQPAPDLWEADGNYQGWGNCQSNGSCSEIFGTPSWSWSQLGFVPAARIGLFGGGTVIPGGITIPAGTVFGIALTTNPSGAVNAITYQATGPAGEFPSVTVPLPTSQQFPVAGFQLNVVGDFNGGTATFTSGMGNIKYSTSSGTICSLTNPTTSCSNSNFGMFTVENSNAMYLPVSPCCGAPISQAMIG